MKAVFFLLLPLATAAAAPQKEIRIQGEAAVELFDTLPNPVEAVIDEHSNAPYAIAKYGKNFGCQRSLESNSTYCWFFGQ